MRKYSKFIILFLLLNAHFLYVAGQSKIVPAILKCELRVNPLGIDISQPGLSYILQTIDAKTRGLRQSAYQIQVSSTLGFKNGGDLWDSKKVMSDRMAYISNQGKALKSSQQCWWKVRVWDQNGQSSAWSPIATWTMGIINPQDWHAKWISAEGADKYALSPVGYKSKNAVYGDSLKWVQIDLEKPQPFAEIRLYPTFFEDQPAFDFPVRFKVEVSDDPSFKTNIILADHSAQDFKAPSYAPVHFYAKSIVNARYIRIAVNKMARTGFSLRQIEVWSSGKNIAAGKPVQALDSEDDNSFNKSNLTDRVEDYGTFPNYSSMMLRKEFGVKPSLVRAVIHISGFSEYELNINGKKVGQQLLTPGWTDYRKTVLYDTYDVTRHLKSGNNAIGIILGNSVYNIQPDTLRYVKFITTFGQAKAMAQLRLEYADGSVKIIATDKTWQVSPGPITYSNLYGGEDYDANLEPFGWNQPDFKASHSWATAIETPGPGGTLKGLSCSAPPIEVIDRIKPVKVTQIRENLWIYDFGQNASMMPELNVRGPKGSSVRVIPSELLGKNGLVDRTSATQNGVRPAWWQYTLKGQGQEKWLPKFFYQGARFLQVELYPATLGGGVPKINELTDAIVHSSSTPVGSFESSNTLFNSIYSLVRWAQRSNMMSLMTDCPQREKMGWLEEDHLNGPSLRYNFDMAPLFRKTMNDMADAQLENGFIPNIAPEYFIAGSPDLTNGLRNSPEWGSSFIIVPWQQYLFSGDISLLQRYYSSMKHYMGFLSAEAKDHIIYTGLGDWYDIGPKAPWGSQLTPVSFTGTAIYYYDNRIMYNIANQLGNEKDAEGFKMEYERVRMAFNKTFYHPETGLYATGSQTTSAMPLFFDLVEPENRQKLLDALISDISKHNNSFTSGEVGYRFLLRALADGGRSDVVYEMNNQSDKPGYGYQLKMGATSLTEKWNAGVGSFGSQNHFMSGQINEWFFNDLVGISPDEDGPGFRKSIVKPAFLKNLEWVKGSFKSMSGDINSEWKRSGDQIMLDLAVPVNTLATMYLPGNNPSVVSEGTGPAAKAKGVMFISKNDGLLKFQVSSGNYHFIFATSR
jgi:alpha-L-rhamnosidase